MKGSVGCTGSRSLGPTWSALVGQVVGAVEGSGRGIMVGCAPGADALVRAAAPGATVFRANSRERWALAVRSQLMVRAVVSSGEGAGLVGFVTGPCPGGIVPGRSWSSGERPSGSWSTLALGVGLGLPVLVFPCGWAWSPPPWPGTWAVAGSGVWAEGWRWVPAARQLGLF